MTTNSSNWLTTVIVFLSITGTLAAAFLFTFTDTLVAQQANNTPTPTATSSLNLITNTPSSIITPTPSPTIKVTPSATPTATPPTPTTQPIIAITPTCPQPSPDWEPYLVQPEDTITSISMVFGISVTAIRQANCLRLNNLLPGTQIYLPQTPLPTPIPCGPPNSWLRGHWVQPGQTLFQLAYLYRVTVYELQQANCLPDTTIRVGQRLYVPFLLPTPVPPTSTPLPTVPPTATPLPAPTIPPPPLPTSSPTATTTTIPPTFTPTPPPTATTPPPPLPTATMTPASYP